jgi:rod shape determining protein RodA
MIAERQRSRMSRIYGYSVASIFFFHFAINIAMTIGLAPVIGIPLPFFSYGGFIALGVCHFVVYFA